MKPKFASRSLILAGIFLSAGHSFAADGTAIQTGAGPFDWSTTTNWSGGTVANGTNSTAFFTANITAPQVINLDADRTIGNITFTDSVSSNNDLTISGANILTLDVNTGIPVIDVTQSARTLTISSQISGSDGLQKSGAGTLVLSGTNDYTGGTVINGGRLTVASDASLGAAGAGITLNGGDLRVQGDGISNRILTLGTAAENFITVNGSYSNNQQVTGTGGVTFRLATSANMAATLSSAANDFTGALGISTGGNTRMILTIHSLADSIGAGNIVFAGTGTSNRQLIWNGSSALTLNHRQIELVAAGATSALIQNNTTNAITINSNLKVTSTGARTLTLNAAAGPRNVFAGNIANSETDSSAVAITKAGGGTWALTNTNNSYTGATTISAGTLEVTKLADFSENSSIGAAASGAILIGSANNTGTLLYTGGAQSTDRTIQINSSTNNNTGGAAIINDGTGALTFTATTFNDAYTNVTASTRTLTLGGTNGGTIQGVIQNNSADSLVGITKTGIGTWVLGGNNSNTGPTTLSAGTLTLDYSTNNNAKFAGALALNGGTLELSGGSAFTQSATSTTLNTGGTFIKRTNSGTNTLSLGAITFSGGAVDFGAGSIATTSTANHTSGALASAAGTYRATVAGADWAKNDGADNIVAFAPGDYTSFTGGATSANVNYSAVGDVTLDATRGATTNTFKITTSGAGQSMKLNSNFNLSLGSLLFAGADSYTIAAETGTGRVNSAFLLHNYGTNNATLTLGATNGLITQFGTGKTILAGNNAGGVGINVFGGTVQFSDNLQIGNQSGVRVISLNNGTLLASDNIALDNGGVNSRTVTLGAGGGTLAAAATKTLTVSGVISGAGNPLTIGSAGSTGTVTLSATNTHTGATFVNAGTLIVNGNISTSVLTTVASDATIGGSGTVGALTIGSGGFINPGNSPGILNTGNYTQMGTYTAEIEGLVAGNSAGNHDQIIVTGTVDITGGSLTTLFSTFTPVNGNLIFILLNDGTDAITGTFSGLAQGDVVDVYGGFNWIISYNADSVANTFTGTPDGNDIALMAVVIPDPSTAIPEPSAALFGAIGLLVLLRRRR